MAKAKVAHSDNTSTLTFRGNKKNPEPSTGVIKFPGGYVEVSRTSDGSYWVHTRINETAEIVGSDIEYKPGKDIEEYGDIPTMPPQERIEKLAVKVNGPYIEN